MVRVGIALLAAFALHSTAGAQGGPPFVITGTGGSSCGDAMEAMRTNHEMQINLYTQWMAGYLAGYAVAAADFRKPLRRKEATDFNTMRGWLEKHCRENPLSNIIHATVLLQKELQK